MIRSHRASRSSSRCVAWAAFVIARFAFPELATAQEPQFTVPDAVARYSSACDAVRTYEVEVLSENFYGVRDAELPANILPTHTKATIQLFSHGHYRSDLLDQSGTKLQMGESAWCWDGLKATSVNKAAGEAMIDTNPSVSQVIESTGYSRLYRDCAPGLSYVKRIEARGLSKTTLQVVEGSPVLTVAMTKESDSFNTVAFRLTLDPNRNYLPARIEHLLQVPGGEGLFVWNDLTIEHQQTKAGVWIPVLGISRAFKVAKGATQPTQIGIERISINFEKARVNHDLPQSRCVLPIPPGVRTIRL